MNGFDSNVYAVSYKPLKCTYELFDFWAARHQKTRKRLFLYKLQIRWKQIAGNDIAQITTFYSHGGGYPKSYTNDLFEKPTS